MSATQSENSVVMILPKNGKQDWTNLMQGAAPVPNKILTGSPIVMAAAKYEDGTWVAGGVLKSDTPTEYNSMFMWVFDKNGTQYPGWPIDVSDNEDFYVSKIYFVLDDDEKEYVLNVIEAES